MDQNISGSSPGVGGARRRPEPATDKQLNKLSYLFRTTRELYDRPPIRRRWVNGTQVDHTLYAAEVWMKENLTKGMASRLIITIVVDNDTDRAIRILKDLGMWLPSLP